MHFARCIACELRGNMSEYQYYEFAAIDRPISDEGLHYARRCSSRAIVSRVRWQNTYHFGDFGGSVDTLLKHYDAHFYIANWGTVRLGLAVPKGAIALKSIEPYLRRGKRYENTLTVKETGDRCILYWERSEEESYWDTEGEGLIDRLTGIREELLRGDYRALFLGWLADFHPDEVLESDGKSGSIPPIPAGLAQLGPALKALIEHFPVDPDALAVAAGLSEAATQGRIAMAAVLETLSISEMRALLARVAEGGGAGVMGELNRLTHPPALPPAGQAMTCRELAEKAIQGRTIRKKKEAAAAREARERKAGRRKQHLASIMQQAATIWSGLEPLMAEKTASTYDQVATHLRDLSDAHAQAGDSASFQQQLDAFRDRYANRPAMLRRIDKL